MTRWQAAMQALLLVAEQDGPTMFARIGMMRALRRHNGHLPGSWDGLVPAYPSDRDIRKLPPMGAALNRSRARVRGSRRVVGSGIIAPRRNNIAHLHRPRRAKEIMDNTILSSAPYRLW
jgi:hypothetical protein